MDTKEKYESKDLEARDLHFSYWGAMNYFIGLIRSSELKAGLILSFYGIIFNFVYQNINSAKDEFSTFGINHVIAILWLISTMISMFHSVRTFIPRIEKKYEPNVFFFGDVISKYGDIKEFSKTLLETSIDKSKLYDQLGQQIYINAKITAAKFKNVNTSLKYLLISLGLLLILVIEHILKTIF
ncbi:MAG: Pycsar system effector family protein [Polaribacter sp.]|uniref:Pycsar system effector family protein n=1 Tax=Polaribacter sp. TaxID=1920175 RepID=UPI003BAE4DE5